jgi:aminoglycoside/choline kinase family phosphotransferase
MSAPNDNKINEALRTIYRDFFGHEAVSLEPLYSHGSDRTMIRIYSSGNSSVIGIYNENTEENNAFVQFSKHFKSQGLNVPEIFHVSDDKKSYLMEDLGDITLFKKISGDKERFGSRNIELYKKAIENLVRFQTEAGKSVDYRICYQFNEFGRENIEFDLNYFRERFLDNFYKEKINEQSLSRNLSFLTHKLLEEPRSHFLYRDFQSRNIMLHKEDLYFIDYQSGRKGALQYDIASLLYDARADIPQELREELLEYYINEVKNTANVDAGRFRHYFWYFAMIRILQAMGAYGFLGVAKGKKRFLESIPFALKNINFILNNRVDKSEFSYLKNILSEIKYEPA